MFKSTGHPSPLYKSNPIPNKPLAKGGNKPIETASSVRVQPPQGVGAGDVTQRNASTNRNGPPTGPSRGGHSVPSGPRG